MAARGVRSVAGAVLAFVAVVALLTGCKPDGRELGITVSGAPSFLAPGESGSFTARITNHGTAPATAAAVTVLTSAVLAPTATGPDGACAAEPSDGGFVLVQCPVGTLDPGDSATVTASVVGGSVLGSQNIAVKATSDRPDPEVDPHPNLADVGIDVGTSGPVDLHVEASRTPPSSLVGQPFTSVTTVANRGPSAASQVTVEQTMVTSVPIGGATLERADGGATGTCAVAPGKVSCTTGAALIEPLRGPDDRWFLRATLQPADGFAFFVDHRATSPHPEVDPDLWPDTARRTEAAGSGGITFEAAGQVPVGAEVDITGHFTGTGPQYAQGLGVGVPAGFELVGVTVGTQQVTCPASGGNCPLPGGVLVGLDPTVLRLRAVAAADVSTGSVFFSSEIGYAGGSFSVQAVDPTRTSEIHPDLTAPDGGVVGEVAAFTGVVRNSGATDHAAVTFEVAVGDGAEVAYARWGSGRYPCETSASTATCSLGSVPGRATVPVEVGVRPTAPGTSTVDVSVHSATPQQSPDPVEDEQSFSLPVVSRAVDLGVAVATTPPTPTQGVALTVVATTTNHGSVVATGSVVSVTLPGSMPVSAATATAPHSPGGGACAIAGQTATCQLGAIGPGVSQEVRVTASVPTTAGGSLDVVVSSATAEPAPDPHPNAYQRTLGVDTPRADLTATFPDVQAAVAGDLQSYQGRVFDYGPSAVTDAVAVATFPAGWTVHTASVDSVGPCAVSGSTATCAVGALHGLGGNRRINFTATPSAAQTAAQITFTVSAGLPDPGPLPNTVVRTFDVAPRVVDLGLATSASATVPAGASDAFVATISNAGPAIAHNTVVTATFPSSVAVDRARFSGTGGSCSVVGQVATCTFAQMVPGQSRPITYTLRHLQHGTPVTYELTATSDQPEAADQSQPNALSVTRTPIPANAELRVWTEDTLGNDLRSTVRVYRPTDGFFPSYTGQAPVGGGWAEFDLPPGEYRVAVSHAGYASSWWQDALTRETATPLVATGLSEQWDLHVVLAPTGGT